MEHLTKNEWIKNKETEPHQIFHGNNVEVLKALVEKYKGKISCIYIDPPYNNGENYSFYSDVSLSLIHI